MAKKASVVFYVTSVFPPLLSPALEAVFGDGVCRQHTAGTELGRRQKAGARCWTPCAHFSPSFLMLCDLQSLLLQEFVPKLGLGNELVLEVWCLVL